LTARNARSVVESKSQVMQGMGKSLILNGGEGWIRTLGTGVSPYNGLAII